MTGNQAKIRKTDKQILDADWKGAVVGVITSGGTPVGIATAYAGGCISSIFEGIGIGFGWW